MTSRLRSVVGSIDQAVGAGAEARSSRTCARSAFCVSRRYCTSAPAARVAARMVLEAEAVEAAVRLHLSTAARAAPPRIRTSSRRPAVSALSSRSRRPAPPDVGEPGGASDLARPQHDRARRRAPGAPSSPAYSAVVNSPVDRSSSATPMPGRRRTGAIAHQERRLARLEIARVGQRARARRRARLRGGRAPCLLRVFDLLADRDAKSLPHEAGDVGVGGVMRHAAHRDGAAAGVLRPRRERQLERARRGQRVLVEHLVEVAHAEEHDGVAVLPLGVEVLPHRRRRAGGFGEHRRRRRISAERLGASITLRPLAFVQ